MKSLVVKAAALGALAVLCAGSANAEDAAGAPVLAKELAPARAGGTLRVTSRVMQWGEALNERFTQDGENRSPAVTWTQGPRGTLSYAVLMEDASVTHSEPVAHWVVYDIPSTAERVAENQPKQAKLDNGALQGLNLRNEAGFIGPKPPAGQTHVYHIEVFALNVRPKLDPAETDRNDLVKAMKGHVMASGEMIVNYTGK